MQSSIMATLIGVQAALIIAATPAHSWADAPSIFTEAQAARGGAAYQTHCASCHGAQLNGIDSAPSLVAPQFISSWRGQPVANLVVRIRSTMPANAPGTLGTSTVEDITAFILKANLVKSGPAEMPKDTKTLQGITIP
jgi:mono/diheme cytochrome c family protein